MTSKLLEKIIKENLTCLIIPHQSPDGDCLGSSYALSHFLDLKGCKNTIAMNGQIPTNFSFLQKDNMRNDFQILESDVHYDVTIVLDTSSTDRIGASMEVVGLGHEILVIDHHKTNTYYGDENVVASVSSVGELLYSLFLPYLETFNQEIAKGLYTSIVTDTGDFRYSNTSAQTLKIVSYLFETGIDFYDINRKIFSNQPLNQVLLKSKVLSNIQSYDNQKIIVTYVTQDLLDEHNCQMFHADGIVEMGRDIENCEVSVLLKEYESNLIKVSMRSNAYVDVSEISLLFDGGGHSRAAGCTLNTDLKEAEKIIVDQIRTRL